MATQNTGFTNNSAHLLDLSLGTISAGKSVAYANVAAANAGNNPSFRNTLKLIWVMIGGVPVEHRYQGGLGDEHLLPHAVHISQLPGVHFSDDFGGTGTEGDPITFVGAGGGISAIVIDDVTIIGDNTEESPLSVGVIPISKVTNLQTTLDGKQASGSYAAASHNHAASDINSGVLNVARLGTGTADNTVFLRGDGTWATPAGGGDSPWTVVDTDHIYYDAGGINIGKNVAPDSMLQLHVTEDIRPGGTPTAGIDVFNIQVDTQAGMWGQRFMGRLIASNQNSNAAKFNIIAASKSTGSYVNYDLPIISMSTLYGGGVIIGGDADALPLAKFGVVSGVSPWLDSQDIINGASMLISPTINAASNSAGPNAAETVLSLVRGGVSGQVYSSVARLMLSKTASGTGSLTKLTFNLNAGNTTSGAFADIFSITHAGVEVHTITEYADNAAAVAASLPVGRVYHTAGVLKVVTA